MVAGGWHSRCSVHSVCDNQFANQISTYVGALVLCSAEGNGVVRGGGGGGSCADGVSVK